MLGETPVETSFRRAFAFPGAARLQRLGIKPNQRGYFKCGSQPVVDWVTALRVLAWDGARWRVVCEKRDLKQSEELIWLDLGRLETTALQVEATECAVDGGWTGWDLVSDTFALEGETPEATWRPIRSWSWQSADSNGVRCCYPPKCGSRRDK